MNSLKDQVAIVTGAGSGIGKAIAREFSRSGIKTACFGRREDRLKSTLEEIQTMGGEAISVAGDVNSSGDTERLVQSVLAKWGRLDVVVSNAGAFNAIGAIWEIDPEEWWRDVTTNLRGPMLMARAALKPMMQQNSGLIVNMSGGGSTMPLKGGSGYGASKTALLRFTETLARELEQEGSKVVVVAMGPGFVKTEMTMLQVDTELGRKWMPSSKEGIESGKVRPPEDCAHTILDLMAHLDPSFNGRLFGTGMKFHNMARDLADAEAASRFLLRISR